MMSFLLLSINNHLIIEYNLLLFTQDGNSGTIPAYN